MVKIKMTTTWIQATPKSIHGCTHRFAHVRESAVSVHQDTHKLIISHDMYTKAHTPMTHLALLTTVPATAATVCHLYLYMVPLIDLHASFSYQLLASPAHTPASVTGIKHLI